MTTRAPRAWSGRITLVLILGTLIGVFGIAAGGGAQSGSASPSDPTPQVVNSAPYAGVPSANGHTAFPLFAQAGERLVGYSQYALTAGEQFQVVFTTLEGNLLSLGTSPVSTGPGWLTAPIDVSMDAIGSPYIIAISQDDDPGDVFGGSDAQLGGIDAYQVLAVPTAPPAAPVGVNAVPGDGQLTVSWSQPSSPFPVSSYTATASAGESCVATTALMCTITGLDPTVPTSVTVTATGDGGTSAASVATAPVLPAIAPTAPTNVTVTSGDAAATVSWGAPSSDGGEPVTGYQVDYRAVGASTWTPGPALGAGASSATVSGLTNDFSYDLRVSAGNLAGSGPAAAAPSTATPFLLAPQITAGGAPLDGATIQPGSSISVSAAGLPLGASVTIVAHSDPVQLASTTVGPSGSVQLTATVPATLPSGAHTLSVTVSGPGIGPSTVTEAFSIAAPAGGAGGTDAGTGAASDPASGTPATATAAAPASALAATTTAGRLANTGSEFSDALAATALALLVAGLLAVAATRGRAPGRRRGR